MFYLVLNFSEHLSDIFLWEKDVNKNDNFELFSSKATDKGWQFMKHYPLKQNIRKKK